MKQLRELEKLRKKTSEAIQHFNEPEQVPPVVKLTQASKEKKPERRIQPIAATQLAVSAG